MKHKFTKEECSKGGINAAINHPELKKIRSERLNKIREKTGKGSKIRGQEENNVKERIKHQYDEIFAPNAVCDKIGFKDGKVYFIEIKRKGQKLRPRQEKFKNLFNEQYIIEYV